jgi:hypothetical protein
VAKCSHSNQENQFGLSLGLGDCFFAPGLLGFLNECVPTEGIFLVTKFEFGGSFGMSLEEDGHEVKVSPNLELLVTFGMSLERVCPELHT